MRRNAGFSARRATTIALVVALVALVASAPSVAGPADRAAAVQSPTICTPQTVLTNGNFESPVLADNSSTSVPNATMPGWQSTDAGVTLFSTGFGGVPVASGRQYGEVSSVTNGALIQDVATTPGQTLGWSLRHRGRRGHAAETA